MKLENIILGRAIRIVRIIGRPGGFYLHDLNQAMVERYGFVKVPTKLEEFDETKGVTYQHGKFSIKTADASREIVIGSFQVYSNGLIADTSSSTDHADQFLDDVIAWAGKTYGITIPDNQKIENIYLSNLEVSTIKPLPVYIPSASILVEDISRYLNQYGLKHEPYEATGFMLHFDKTLSPNSFLTNFTLARREGVPFAAGLYFSSAPLKTTDHIALLEKLEKT